MRTNQRSGCGRTERGSQQLNLNDSAWPSMNCARQTRFARAERRAKPHQNRAVFIETMQNNSEQRNLIKFDQICENEAVLRGFCTVSKPFLRVLTRGFWRFCSCSRPRPAFLTHQRRSKSKTQKRALHRKPARAKRSTPPRPAVALFGCPAVWLFNHSSAAITVALA